MHVTNIMKICSLIICDLISICGATQAVCVKAGHSLIPGGYWAIGYEHYTNGLVNAKFNCFGESSRKNGFQYSAYGIDLIGEYASNQNEPVLFAYRLGFGITGQIENEPWVYQNIAGPKKINYGLVGELAGEWWMSEQFCLSVFGQQQYLFNSALGNTRFVFGLGLKFHLDNN